MLRCNRDMWDDYLVQKINEEIARQNEEGGSIPPQAAQKEKMICAHKGTQLMLLLTIDNSATLAEL